MRLPPPLPGDRRLPCPTPVPGCAAARRQANLVCTQERILKIFRITGLTKVFGIHETVDQAIAATKGTQR